LTQIKLHFLFKITSKVIHSFEPVVTFYSLPKQRLVTLSENESSSHDLKHCVEKSIHLACQIPVEGKIAAKPIIFEQTEAYLSFFKTVSSLILFS